MTSSMKVDVRLSGRLISFVNRDPGDRKQGLTYIHLHTYLLSCFKRNKKRFKICFSINFMANYCIVVYVGPLNEV